MTYDKTAADLPPHRSAHSNLCEIRRSVHMPPIAGPKLVGNRSTHSSSRNGRRVEMPQGEPDRGLGSRGQLSRRGRRPHWPDSQPRPAPTAAVPRAFEEQQADWLAWAVDTLLAVPAPAPPAASGSGSGGGDDVVVEMGGFAVSAASQMCRQQVSLLHLARQLQTCSRCLWMEHHRSIWCGGLQDSKGNTPLHVAAGRQLPTPTILR